MQCPIVGETPNGDAAEVEGYDSITQHRLPEKPAPPPSSAAATPPFPMRPTPGGKGLILSGLTRVSDVIYGDIPPVAAVLPKSTKHEVQIKTPFYKAKHKVKPAPPKVKPASVNGNNRPPLHPRTISMTDFFQSDSIAAASDRDSLTQTYPLPGKVELQSIPEVGSAPLGNPVIAPKPARLQLRGHETKGGEDIARTSYSDGSCKTVITPSATNRVPNGVTVPDENENRTLRSKMGNSVVIPQEQSISNSSKAESDLSAACISDHLYEDTPSSERVEQKFPLSERGVGSTVRGEVGGDFLQSRPLILTCDDDDDLYDDIIIAEMQKSATENQGSIEALSDGAMAISVIDASHSNPAAGAGEAFGHMEAVLVTGVNDAKNTEILVLEQKLTELNLPDSNTAADCDSSQSQLPIGASVRPKVPEKPSDIHLHPKVVEMSRLKKQKQLQEIVEIYDFGPAEDSTASEVEEIYLSSVDIYDSEDGDLPDSNTAADSDSPQSQLPIGASVRPKVPEKPSNIHLHPKVVEMNRLKKQKQLQEITEIYDISPAEDSTGSEMEEIYLSSVDIEDCEDGEDDGNKRRLGPAGGSAGKSSNRQKNGVKLPVSSDEEAYEELVIYEELEERDYGYQDLEQARIEALGLPQTIRHRSVRLVKGRTRKKLKKSLRRKSSQRSIHMEKATSDPPSAPEVTTPTPTGNVQDAILEPKVAAVSPEISSDEDDAHDGYMSHDKARQVLDMLLEANNVIKLAHEEKLPTVQDERKEPLEMESYDIITDNSIILPEPILPAGIQKYQKDGILQSKSPQEIAAEIKFLTDTAPKEPPPLPGMQRPRAKMVSRSDDQIRTRKKLIKSNTCPAFEYS